MDVYFVASVAVLAVLLFFPVSRLIWVLSVRRLERKTGTALAHPQRRGQLTRSRLIATIVTVLFSLLFNLYLFRQMGHG